MCRFVRLAVLLGLVLAFAVGCSDDTALQSAQAEVAEGNATIASLNADVASLNSELDGAKETVASLNAELDGANETIQEQQDGIAEWEAANASREANLDEALGAVDEWSVAFAGKERELTEARAGHEAALASAVEEKAAVQKLLDKVKADLAAVQAVLNQTQAGSAAATAAERRVQLLTERAAELEAQIDGFRSEIERITGEHTRLQAEYHAFLQERCSIRSDETPYWTTIRDVSYDLIVRSDPTSLQSLTYIGRGERNVSRGQYGSSGSILWQHITIDAYLFEGLYDDATVEFQVNPEFGSEEAAREQVDKFAAVFGRIPAVLLSRLESVVIHKDGGVWAASWESRNIHLTVDGDEHIRRGTVEEALTHEAAHVSLDGAHRNSVGWIEAQMKDCSFISGYARDNPTTEDIAESFLPYFALRYFPERLSDSNKAAILNTMPNRIAYFDEQGLGPEG